MKHGAAQPDADLAGSARQGDRQAFELLVQRHKGALFRLIRRHVGSDDDSYDVLQETFVSAWLALSRYDARRSFAVWLRAIALNKCRDYGRRLSVRRRFLRLLARNESEFTPAREAMHLSEQMTAEDMRLNLLDTAIAALPAFYKEPLLLMTVSGLSQRETADQLNTTPKAIEMRIRRARKKLADAFSSPRGEIREWRSTGIVLRKK